MPRNENMIAALKRERAGYAARGDADRVAQVDEQIRAYGGEPPAEQPEGRQVPPQQTADDEPKAAAAKTGTRRATK
jgi:hypothetical protein